MTPATVGGLKWITYTYKEQHLARVLYPAADLHLNTDEPELIGCDITIGRRFGFLYRLVRG